jgi:UDP-N-acetylmuramoyl-L-alanyl-D-glutamate--2,6-diaminopimelate ligase
MTVAGITGTNGKTTCAWLLANALQHCGRPAAYMGTLGVGLAGASGIVQASTHTTADAVTVHRALAELRLAGAKCVAMEVSSHALDQGRINGIRLHAAAFTNLTRDHLDYHLSMEAYGAAKAKLFDWDGLQTRVVNVDDEFGEALAGSMSDAGRLIVTARGRGIPSLARISSARTVERLLASAVVADAEGLAFDFICDDSVYPLRLPLIGEFNVDNALIVLGLLRALDVPVAQAIRALSLCRAPTGRMETFSVPGSALAIVDYAHTPDALVKALKAARVHCLGTLHVVFGCGGDRDRGKRSQMATAATAADDIVLTDDNPRSEAPEQIVADIAAGLPPGRAFSVEHDRAAAIRRTLARSISGDVVLIAGKGHEAYQIYGTDKRRFSDQDVVRAALGIGA